MSVDVLALLPLPKDKSLRCSYARRRNWEDTVYRQNQIDKQRTAQSLRQAQMIAGTRTPEARQRSSVSAKKHSDQTHVRLARSRNMKAKWKDCEWRTRTVARISESASARKKQRDA